MIKKIRITIGSLLALMGLVLFIIPGSSLFLLLGLVVLSYDVPKAREWLTKLQTSMSNSARRLDRFILRRKLKS
ncbi:tellurium resistance protein TerC [Paraglaciecola sp. 2405UD69-4]|uniref:tellurium resistance protein TerC n=1 Tax=Paraglaciecola sp. 2405UD69-4 TaxID=3391836 RepID=UPI0039C991C2